MPLIAYHLIWKEKFYLPCQGNRGSILGKIMKKVAGDILVSMVSIIQNFMIFQDFFKIFKEDPKPF